MTMLSSMEALTILAHHRTNEIVVTHKTTARQWVMISTMDDMDVPIWGAMGKASSFSLGLALACPNRRIVVLDADGSLLMNLGTLVTIAEMAPANLVLFVFENGVYRITGRQPIPGKLKVDFAAIAKGAGFPKVYTIANSEDLDGNLEQILHEEGPVFVDLKITVPPDKAVPVLSDRYTADALYPFKRALLNPEG